MAVTRPIWQDTFYESGDDVLAYTIRLNGEVIFQGRGYKMPDADTLRININRTVQNYLSSEIEPLLAGASSETNLQAFRTFEMYDGNGALLETYNFLYDWSYKEWNGDTKVMSNPINGHLTTGMLSFKTEFNGQTMQVTTAKDTSLYTDGYCGEWALYYLNASGGWDAFLIEGNVTRTDKVTQHNFNKSFDNNTRQFETGRYISEIETSYEMTTGLLSDDESERLSSNLLGSGHIYAHNLNENRIIPVLIEDTSIPFKTYQNQGKKPITYTINVKESQTKIRK